MSKGMLSLEVGKRVSVTLFIVAARFAFNLSIFSMRCFGEPNLLFGPNIFFSILITIFLTKSLL